MNEVDKIRTLIIDDEPLAREGVRMRLRAEPDIELIGECRNGREGVAAIVRDAPDLVFLDIQMPKLDGFGVIETVGARQMPQVIFLTAYDEHAVRAFEVHALDYLLKPIDGERFRDAIDRARKRIRGQSLEVISEQLNQMLAALRTPVKHLDRLPIKSRGRITFMSVEEIDWIEAADNYVQIHSGRQSHLLHATLNSLESKLDSGHFLRIHRSTIVNISRIKELHAMFHGEFRVVLKDATELTSGRRYKKNLQRLVNDL
ncbi:MAG TPA: LytTR family transcriptional regulator DNA-binding domain-containing protein [Blastocatellia bacterium]|nr:LytTR family transcriptional regulator DNA-binding domain-containing protein [Blastocatellia bacterium]